MGDTPLHLACVNHHTQAVNELLMNMADAHATNSKVRLYHHPVPLLLLLSYSVVILTKLTQTSRDRPKSAPYLTLKNCRRTSKCQAFSFTVPEKLKSWTEVAPLERDPLGFLTSFLLQNIKKNIEAGPFEDIKNFSRKSLTVSKKTKRGPFSFIRHCILR